jgi:hypothetical protein
MTVLQYAILRIGYCNSKQTTDERDRGGRREYCGSTLLETHTARSSVVSDNTLLSPSHRGQRN